MTLSELFGRLLDAKASVLEAFEIIESIILDQQDQIDDLKNRLDELELKDEI